MGASRRRKKKASHRGLGLGLGDAISGHPDPRKGSRGFRNYATIDDMPPALLRHFAREALDAESAACRMTMTELTGSTRHQGPITKSVVAVFNALLSFVDWRKVPRQLVCHPSYEVLSERANVGTSTARHAITVLEDFGWVRKRNVLEPNPVLRNNLKKIYTSNEYTITIPVRWHTHFTKGAKVGLSILQRNLNHRIEALVCKKYSHFVDNFYTCLNRVCTNQRVRQLVGAIYNDIPGPPVAEPPRKWFLDLQPGLSKLRERFSGVPADPRPPHERTFSAFHWLDPFQIPPEVAQAGEKFVRGWELDASLYRLFPPEKWTSDFQEALWERRWAAQRHLRAGII
jgi:hypothetical protein